MTFPTINTPVLAATGSGTTLTASMPATVTAGQRLMMGVRFSSSGAITMPAGWTLVASSTAAAPACAVFEKKSAAGTEGGTTVNVTGPSSSNFASFAVTVDGSDTAAAAEGSGVAGGVSTTPDPPSVTPSWGAADTLWIAFQGNVSGSSVSAYPTNYTLAQATAARIGVAARQLNASSENPGTFTTGGGGTTWQAFTIAVKPAGATAYTLNVDQGAYALTGEPVGWGIGWANASGSYTLSGKTVAWGIGWALAQGAYALTGEPAAQAAAINNAQGSYALTGEPVGWGIGTPFAFGSYALSGFAVSWGIGWAVAQGAYALTGQIASQAIKLGAAFGSYILTGFAATFIAPSLRLIAETGYYFVDSVGAAMRVVQLAAAGVRRVVAPFLSQQRFDDPALGQTRLDDPALQQTRAEGPSLSLRRSVSSALQKLRAKDPDLR